MLHVGCVILNDHILLLTEVHVNISWQMLLYNFQEFEMQICDGLLGDLNKSKGKYQVTPCYGINERSKGSRRESWEITVCVCVCVRRTEVLLCCVKQQLICCDEGHTHTHTFTWSSWRFSIDVYGFYTQLVIDIRKLAASFQLFYFVVVCLFVYIVSIWIQFYVTKHLIIYTHIFL